MQIEPQIIGKNTFIIKIFLVVTLVFIQFKSTGQNMAIGSIEDQYLRNLQLLGSVDANISFSVRPLSRSVYKGSLGDSLLKEFTSLQKVPQNKGLYKYGLHLDYEGNSSRPFSWNNGAMLNAKGVQYRISSGLLYHSRLFTVNFMPEFISAANKPYEVSAFYGNPAVVKFKKFFPGQSYLQLNLGKKVGIGYSNENLWWGPGQLNSMLMSNNAPGFGHLFFSTRAPVKTPIGSFEWQLISAGLDQDSLMSSEVYHQQIAPYTRKWRYLNSILISYQPRVLPGMFLGFSRNVQFYGNFADTLRSGFLKNYLPIVAAFLEKKINTQQGLLNEKDYRDQQAAIFMRYVMPKSKFEFYFEYGFNDFKDNLRDLIVDAQHSSAYIIGFKKIVPLTSTRFYSISGEITQMGQSADFIVRNAGNWYMHGDVKQGYTHLNQIMGAGSGIGNNLQQILVEYYFGKNKIGFKLQRIDYDPARPLTTLNQIWLSPKPWIDIAAGPTFHKMFKKVGLKGEMQFVESKNYAWKNKSKFNLSSSLNMFYRW